MKETLLRVSIHAPRVGRDARVEDKLVVKTFQFTRPAWGATVVTESVTWFPPCFNSRAPRGARRASGAVRSNQVVSIHAPRVGRDRVGGRGLLDQLVSIHAPRVGRDRGRSIQPRHKLRFQFTRPAWGAT